MIQRLVEEGLGFGVYNTAGKIWDFGFCSPRILVLLEHCVFCVFQKLWLLAGIKDDWKSYGIDDDTAATWRGFTGLQVRFEILNFCSQGIFVVLRIGTFVSFKNSNCLLVSKMIGKVLGLRMIHQLVEELLGFTTLHVSKILDFAHKGYFCFWVLGFFVSFRSQTVCWSQRWWKSYGIDDTQIASSWCCWSFYTQILFHQFIDGNWLWNWDHSCCL